MNWAFLSAAILCASYTDLKWNKLPNWLTMSAVAAGFAVHLTEGMSGVGVAAEGMGLGFAIMLLLHLFGALGAGDVKLFAGIGALAGPGFVMALITYSIVYSGIIGLIILVMKKGRIPGISAVWFALLHLFCLKSAEPLKTLGRRKDLLHFPFMLAVLPGIATAAFERMF